MDPFAPDPYGLLRRTDFVRAGRNDRALRRAGARGEFIALVPGVFVSAEVWQKTEPRERHLLRAAAVAERLSDGAVFSHATAAAAHGWGFLAPWPDVPDLSAAVARSRRGSTGHVHAARLSGLDVDSRLGLPITAAGRTAVDLVVDLPFRDAVVSLDSALAPPPRRRPRANEVQKTLLTLREFDEALSRRLPVRAHQHVRRVRAFADGAAGSAGESLSRVIFHERGWPAPMLQVPFFDREGKIGEVDCFWKEFGVIGEFDGFVKYSRGEYLGGMTPAEAVVKEKRREDRLRAHPEVRGFARWMWSDLADPRRLGRILAAAGLPIR